MKIRKLNTILLLIGCIVGGYIAITQKDLSQEKTSIEEVTQSITIDNENNSADSATTTDIVQNNSSDLEVKNTGTFTVRTIGETCGESIGQCAQGLKCMYPCGIQGCANVCLPEDELPRP
ncbi:MAG: hypothetical protein MUD00_02460 [Candidatus Pacebacteria bacterium]|jgi:hypothetical protein|nr:hypothetical protein [Candidatus Paceibacterota bacterium]